MKKHILFVNPCADIGGAEMSLLLLLKGLEKSQYKLSLLLPSEGMVAERAREMGVHLEFIDLHPLMIERNIPQSLQDSAQSIFEVQRIKRLLKDLQVDLVHINSYRMGIPVSIAARSLNIPSVWHLRDIPESKFKKKLVGLISKLPTKIIAISKAVAQSVGIDYQANAQIIYNGVDLSLFQAVVPGKFRQELSIPADAILLCSIGQLIPWKGHDFLIKAFADIAATDPRLYLVIVGGNIIPTWADPKIYSIYPHYLRQLVSDYGLDERVVFTGFRQDVPQILTDIDLYIHAATSPEPFGRVLVEAMAAHKPILAPNWGGIPEIVIDQHTGFLFEPNNTRHLQETLAEMLKDKNRMLKMGNEGYSIAQEKFTVENYVNGIERIYAQLLQV